MRPLNPLPGDSLRHREADLKERFYEAAIYPAIAILLAAHEWLAWWQNIPRVPWLFTVFACIIAIRYLPKASQALKELHNVRKGIKGEVRVGQLLETFRTYRYRVYHDIQTDKGNIDHILIGPTGIYTIETKTRSVKHPSARNAKYDGDTVTLNGKPMHPKALQQAYAQAKWLENMLQARLKTTLPVRPVLILPGWVVETPSPRPRIWVENEDTLTQAVKHSPQTLDAKTICRIAAAIQQHLSNYGTTKATRPKPPTPNPRP